MKSYLSLFGFIFFSALTLSAQDADLSIYFKSGSAHLSTSAQKGLDEDLAKISISTDFKLQIKGYTDEIGTKEYNNQLAKRRANTVADYLLKKGYTKEQLEIEAIGELLESKDAQKGRRVDVFIQEPTFESLTMFIEYWEEKGHQQFEYSNLNDLEIKGQKGSRISIAAKSLVTKDGRTPNKVRIQLLEALDYKDMLLYQLSTTSGEKPLETGGMVELRAFDANTGEELELKEGALADIRLPSSRPLKEGMQLFFADERANSSDILDWQAQNQPFVSMRRQPEVNQIQSKIRKSSYKHKLTAEEILREKELPLLEIPEQLEFKKQPKNPQEPRAHQIKKIKTQTKEELLISNPKKKRESKQDYEKRIGFLLKQEKRKAEKVERQNRYGIVQYQQDSIQYKKDLKNYQEDSLAYLSYQKELKTLALKLYQEKEIIQEYIGEIKNRSLAQGYDVQVGYLEAYFKSYQKYIEYRKIDAVKKSLRKTLEAVRINEDLVNKGMAALQKEEAIMELLLKNCYFWKSINLEGRIQDEVDLELLKLAEKENLLEEDWQQIESKIQWLYKKMDKIENSQSELKKNIHQMAKKVMNSSKEDFLSIMENVDSVKMALGDVYIKELKDKGFLTKREVQSAYYNVISSKRLGWINCDRFYKYKGAQTELVVKVDPTANLQFYLVFEEMKMVLPLRKLRYAYRSGTIPLAQKAHLIGLWVKDREIQLSVQNFELEPDQEIVPEFKQVKLEDIESALTGL